MAKPDYTTVHGVFIIIENIGVLITGQPGVGKSSSAFALIDRGYCLVADDIIDVCKQEDQLIGSCPSNLQHFLKIRDIEIININKLYGSQACTNQHRIQLIIQLMPESQHDLNDINGSNDTQTILDIILPRINLHNKHNDLALIIKNVVKNYILKSQGYNASHDFSWQHKQTVELTSCV